MRVLVLFALCNLVLGLSTGLYGLSGEPQLISVNPTTGVITNFGVHLPTELEAQQVSVVDQQNGVLYFLGANATDKTAPETVVGLSLTTGKIVTTLPTPFSPFGFFGAGQSICIDYQKKQFLLQGAVQGKDRANQNTLNLISMDMSTGKWENIITFDGIPVLGGTNEFDPVNRVQVLTISTENSINLMGVNVDTGKVVFNTSDAIWNLGTLNYDPKSGLMYGIGVTTFANNSFIRTLLKFDALEGTFELVANIADYNIMQGSISALDTNNRILYSYMDKGSAGTGPFYLVGINIDSGKVVSSPQGCAENGNNCPWNLEYYSGVVPNQ